MSESDEKSVIEPTPSQSEYTQGASYQDALEANAAPIFERDDPIALFEDWMTDARAHEINDSNAMALATVDGDGMPDVRMVLLKGIDARGFTFFTHESSAKGQQITGNGKAALCFHWKSLRRQVRVRGAVTRIADAEADAYYASRARASKLGAWASDQSQPLQSREQFEAELAEVAARFEGQDIPRPPLWHGYRVNPLSIEFWRDRPFRLHDRLVFLRNTHDEPWTKGRLYP